MEDNLIRTRLQLLEEFNAAPIDAWFGQETVAAIQNRSISSVERDRWIGIGIPFLKCVRSVRYRKRDILTWLDKQTTQQSTTTDKNKAPK